MNKDLNREEYFKALKMLYESTNLNEAPSIGMAGSPEVVRQENIADKGSDLQDPALTPQIQPPVTDPNAMGFYDPMMQDPMMMQPQPMTPAEKQEKERSLKLFDLFEDLLEYTKVFLENCKLIDIGLLTNEDFTTTNTFLENIKSLQEKITRYLVDMFDMKNYDRDLYSYILFRTELLINIKGIRDLLHLDMVGKLDKKEKDNL